jgi:hypothetical protein
MPILDPWQTSAKQQSFNSCEPHLPDEGLDHSSLRTLSALRKFDSGITSCVHKPAQSYIIKQSVCLLPHPVEGTVHVACNLQIPLPQASMKKVCTTIQKGDNPPGALNSADALYNQ